MIALQDGAQHAAAAVQQDALVLLRQLKGGAYFVGAHPVHVAHRDHEPLPFRQAVKGLIDNVQRLAGQRPPFGLVPPPG